MLISHFSFCLCHLLHRRWVSWPFIKWLVTKLANFLHHSKHAHEGSEHIQVITLHHLWEGSTWCEDINKHCTSQKILCISPFGVVSLEFGPVPDCSIFRQNCKVARICPKLGEDTLQCLHLVRYPSRTASSHWSHTRIIKWNTVLQISNDTFQLTGLLWGLFINVTQVEQQFIYNVKRYGLMIVIQVRAPSWTFRR